MDTSATIGQSARVTGSRDVLNTRRVFAWGIVIIGDAGTQDIPSPNRDNAIVKSDSAVVAMVRHAQDVVNPEDDEFLVEVQCSAGVAGRDEASFDGDIFIASGRISVGDADHEDKVSVEPGRWRLQVAVEPIEHPERVNVWFSPALGASTH